MKNSDTSRAKITIKASLPSFLARRNWAVQFLNAGQDAFPLGAGESTYVKMRLSPGQDFLKFDVQQASDRVIHVEAYADGIPIGGMSYALDPDLDNGEPQSGEPPLRVRCVETGASLMHCLDLSQSKVKELRVRRVNIDLVLEDECSC